MKLLVAIDHSPLADRVADEAAKLAQASGATLSLLHVAKGTRQPDIAEIEPPEDVEYRREQLDALAARLRTAGATVETHVKVTDGAIAAVVVDEAVRQRADLVVVGSHNRGRAFELFVGSCTVGVIREALVPVVVVNGLTSVGGPG
jgi:nucleotide-binding universal stress UspA family protein